MAVDTPPNSPGATNTLSNPDIRVPPSDPHATAGLDDESVISERLLTIADELPAGPPSAPPGFDILGELGRGGMGVVYHARQTKLNREVALKMILTGGHASAEDRLRFLGEAETIAALNHPGIVQIYEFGTHAGHPYFALEYCPAGSLAKRLKGTPLPARTAALVTQRIATIMHAAHLKGIVHRDLKPANVLLTRADPKLTPKGKSAGKGQGFYAFKITDFGLAKRLESGQGITQTGAVMGTPNYMAPEQALGETKRIGPATDVYATGAVLYELLTGRPPFHAATPFDTLLQVLNEEPVPVRQLQRKTPPDLETICHKCLQKDPTRRYESTEALAADLGRWLKGDAISARPAGYIERTMKRMRRRPTVVALFTVCVLGLTALTACAIRFDSLLQIERQQVRQTNEVLEASQAELVVKEAALGQAQTDLKAFQAELIGRKADLKQWQTEAKETDIGRVRSELSAARAELSNKEKELNRLRTEAKEIVARAELTPSAIGLHPTATALKNLARYSMNWAENRIQAGDALGALRALNCVPPELRQWEWGYYHGRALRSFLTLWIPTNPAPTAMPTHPNYVTSVAVSPDGQYVASGCGDSIVRIWNANTRERHRAFENGHSDLVTSVAFSPDGRWLVSGGADDSVKIWEMKTGNAARTLATQCKGVLSLAFSPDGQRLAIGGGDATIRIWNAITWVPDRILRGHSKLVSCVAFSPDGARLASASYDKTVKLWDLNSRTADHDLEGHADLVTSVAFSPDGDWLASGSTDSTVKIWSAKRRGAALQTLAGHSGPVYVAFTPNGERLASGAGNNLKIWDFKSGALLLTLPAHTNSITSVAFSRDGHRLVSGSYDSTVRISESITGMIFHILTGHNNKLCGIAFSPDSSQVASRDIVGKCKVWSLADGSEVFGVITPEWLRSDSAAFRSPDGQWFAIPISDGAIMLIKPLPSDQFGGREAMAKPNPDWNWEQAQLCEKNKSWFAALFHCEQVLKSRPDDQSAKKLLETARKELDAQRVGNSR